MSYSFRHRLNGYLVLQGNVPLRTSQVTRIAELFARTNTWYP